MKQWISGFITFLFSCIAASASAAQTSDEGTGFPLWVDQSQAGALLIETVFPSRSDAPLEVPAAGRFLIVRLEVSELEDPARAAFDLKNMVVRARTHAPPLKVALEGPKALVTRLVSHGLAPYIDAYLEGGEHDLPADDPTARIWWRVEVPHEAVLDKLLEAGSRGVELVVLEGITLGPAQRAHLEKIEASPAILFELASGAPQPPHARVVVEDSPILDPYEIVVMNQVFQEQEAAKVESLDVIEELYTLGQRPRSRPVRREYRVLVRRGHPTEYVWNGLAINGVEFPEKKLRQGFIFDADQVLVDPLSIEFDRTYAYSYLGEEILDGHATWKIAFRPLREGSFLSGTVWIDQETHAQRKLEARQSGTEAPVAHREFTVHYQWVEDGGQRFWTWTHREGTTILSYLGFHQPVQVEIERRGHKFNRDGLETDIAALHLSDKKILRQTPEGMRWLTREKPRKQNREGEDDGPSGAQGRVLSTDRNAFIKAHRVGLALVYDPELGEASTRLAPDYSYFNLSLLGSKFQTYINARDSVLGVARPGVLRENWTLSLGVDAPDDRRDRELGARREEDVDFTRLGLTLALAMPLKPWLSVYARYRPAYVEFEGLEHTDPAFALPLDHLEHRGQVEVKFDRRGFSSEFVVEYARREKWEPWGLQLGEPLEPSYVRAALRAGYSRQLTRNQSVGLHASYARGSGLDRFSRIRLGFQGLRVAGYSSQIRFEEGFGMNFTYSGHFLKLFPLQVRFDYASIRPDRALGGSEYLLGAEVVTTLHGPWKTDVLLGLGQGISTSIEGADDTTRFVAAISRRF